MTTFGEELRRLREARRWSQTRLAVEARCDHSYVSRLEDGTRQPTREMITVLWMALGADARDLDRLYMAAGYLPNDPDLLNLIDDWLGRSVLVWTG